MTKQELIDRASDEVSFDPMTDTTPEEWFAFTADRNYNEEEAAEMIDEFRNPPGRK